jgi:hypothetical protein
MTSRIHLQAPNHRLHSKKRRNRRLSTLSPSLPIPITLTYQSQFSSKDLTLSKLTTEGWFHLPLSNNNSSTTLINSRCLSHSQLLISTNTKPSCRIQTNRFRTSMCSEILLTQVEPLRWNTKEMRRVVWITWRNLDRARIRWVSRD